MIDTRLLRSFLVVAEELHFGRAAARLHLTQPPLTRQMQQLESELGEILLFDRRRRAISLTAAGQTLREEARQILARLDDGIERTRRVARGELGRLRIGFVSTADYSILPRLLKGFSAHYPDVELELFEATTAEQEERFEAGSLDVGLVLEKTPSTQRSFLRVHEESLVAVLPRTSRWTRTSAPLRLSSLAAEPFVLFPRHLAPALYDTILGYARRAGVEPRVAQEARQMQTIIGLVAGGLGVSLVPASMENLRRPDVTYRALRPSPPRISTYLTWCPDPDAPILDAFLTIGRRSLRKKEK